MKFIPYSVNSGSENMAIDAKILEDAIASDCKEPVFRLYGWSPACISLGRNQQDAFLNKNFLKTKNIDIVRRLTGGRALLHEDEITYSFVCPVDYLQNGTHIVSSYKEISQILIDKFKLLGIDLNFGSSKPVKTGFDYCMLISTGADLCYQNKKLIGSAQFRKNNYILQHGSILYDYKPELLETIFGEHIDTGDITCIKQINPDLTKDKIIEILGSGQN